MTDFTKTVFASKKIKYVYENDYYSVVATQDIKKGDVLMIEHVLHADEDDSGYLICAVKCSEELFNSLYPRSLKWTEELAKHPTDKFRSMCKEKAEKNAFFGNGLLRLGLDISKINHSDEFNCTTTCSRNKFEPLGIVVVMSIVAVRDIRKDEEITIYYGDGKFGSKGTVYAPCAPQSLDFIERKLTDYFKTEEFKKLLAFDWQARLWYDSARVQ